MFLRSVPLPPTSLQCISDVIFPRDSATVHSSRFARRVKLFSSGACSPPIFLHSSLSLRLALQAEGLSSNRLAGLKKTLGKYALEPHLPHLLGEVTGLLAILCQANLGMPHQMCPSLKKSGKCFHQEDLVLLKSRVFSEAHLGAVC